MLLRARTNPVPGTPGTSVSWVGRRVEPSRPNRNAGADRPPGGARHPDGRGNLGPRRRLRASGPSDGRRRHPRTVARRRRNRAHAPLRYDARRAAPTRRGADREPTLTPGGSVTEAQEPEAFVPLRSRAKAALEAAWERATAAGALPPVGANERPQIEIERPANPDHGDLSSNLAMKLARPCRMAPLRIAEALAAELRADAGQPGSIVGAVTVAPPGFLNLTLSDGALADVVSAVLARPDAWGRVPAATPHRVNVEFVSANPTGPLHIGNARGAFVGDLLCRVLEAAGHTVTREYYFNDFGAQVRNLGASVVALRRGEPLPEEAYRGAYVGELAAEIPDDVWTAAEAAGADPVEIVGQWASERVRAGIEASLAHLGVRFDAVSYTHLTLP